MYTLKSTIGTMTRLTVSRAVSVHLARKCTYAAVYLSTIEQFGAAVPASNLGLVTDYPDGLVGSLSYQQTNSVLVGTRSSTQILN
jgi:hypothetical protein